MGCITCCGRWSTTESTRRWPGNEALLLADRVVLLTHRPARVADVLTIERPRDPAAAFEEDYQRRRQAILEFLGHAPVGAH